MLTDVSDCSGKRILFLCPALAAGKSGVGDYTRRLAAECRKLGAQVHVVSLNESELADNCRMSEERQNAETSIGCSRFHATWTEARKKSELQRLISLFQPDWISLQFVAFGYHPRGLPWAMTTWLKSIPGKHRWHIMFHEVWAGAMRRAKPKLWVLGALQKVIVRRLLHGLNPTVVHSQSEPHILMLRELGFPVNKLPLFGNVPISPNGENAGRRLIGIHLPKGSAESCNSKEVRTFSAGMFGAVHPEWDPEPFFSRWIDAAAATGRIPMLIILGRHGRSEEQIDKLLMDYTAKIRVRVLGELSEIDISQALQTLDFGIGTTPWQLIEKSGGIAAMLEHGLSVVVTRNDWQLRGYNVCPRRPKEIDNCYLAAELTDIELQLLHRREATSFLPRVASAFLSSLFSTK